MTRHGRAVKVVREHYLRDDIYYGAQFCKVSRKGMSPSSSKQHGRADNGETLTLNQIKTLGEQLLSSRAHINHLPRLLSFLSPSAPPEFALESLLTLQSFFVTTLPEIQASPSRPKSLASESTGEDDESPENVYRAWLRSRFDEFMDSLIQMAVCPDSEESVKDVVLDALMEFVKLGKGGRFQSAIYHRFIHTIVNSTSSVQPIMDLMGVKFFKFIDVRYFTYVSLGKITSSYEPAFENGKANSDGVHKCEFRFVTTIHNVYNILARIPILDGSNGDSNCEMWCESGLSQETYSAPSSEVNGESRKLRKANNGIASASLITKKLKAKFSKAWILFLKLPLPLDIYKEVLVTLPHSVIPHFTNPVILCDFLTRSYDIGGVISVMALSSIFILITQHGVEYPNFYDKLYGLLSPSIFMAKHRARFLQLLDTSLKSSHVPAYVAAAFTKKLSRLSLLAPPSGSLVIIAIIHNLLRRHPSINFLVQQHTGDEDDRADRSTESTINSDADPRTGDVNCGIDPFDVEECDLMKSNATRSSLWEIDTMHHHYCPAVSRFVASLENDLTVRSKTAEVTVADFCSGSYSTIFREEIKRRVKQVPLSFYKATPTSLFSEPDFPGWSFGDQLCDKGNGNVDKIAVFEGGIGLGKSTEGEDDLGHLPKRQKAGCS